MAPEYYETGIFCYMKHSFMRDMEAVIKKRNRKCLDAVYKKGILYEK